MSLPPGRHRCRDPGHGQGGSLPAAAQGFVDRDQAGRGVRAALRQLVLGLKLRPFGVEHVQEPDQAALVARPGDLRCGVAFLSSSSQLHQPVAGPGMGHQGIFGFLQGLEYGLLVGRQVRVGTGPGPGNARPHPT